MADFFSAHVAPHSRSFERYHVNSYLLSNTFVICLFVKIALQRSAVPFPPLSDPRLFPFSRFEPSALDSVLSSLPVRSANLRVLGRSALAFLFPRSSFSAKGCRLRTYGCPLSFFAWS